MDFAYYVVRKKDMVILDGAADMVSAINIGQQQNCACLIIQACVISEVGQDAVEEFEEKPELTNDENKDNPVEIEEAELL